MKEVLKETAQIVAVAVVATLTADVTLSLIEKIRKALK